MNISNKIENDNEKKLKKLLNMTNNLYNIIINTIQNHIKDNDINDDIVSISNTLNILMKYCEQIFKYYLVIPKNSTKDESKK